jgi:hypothetical protein
VVAVGTFVDRIQVLRDNVGAGKLEGTVTVDQRYAADQHFHDEYYHPDGGKAYYLRDPLYAGQVQYLQHYADRVLADDGNAGSGAMMDNMEHLSDAVYEQAPWEFADLRASGHPRVEHDGAVVHDRAPHVARLTDSEIAEKRKLSRLIDPHRYER